MGAAKVTNYQNEMSYDKKNSAHWVPIDVRWEEDALKMRDDKVILNLEHILKCAERFSLSATCERSQPSLPLDCPADGSKLAQLQLGNVRVLIHVPMLARLNAFWGKMRKVFNVFEKKILITKLVHLRR